MGKINLELIEKIPLILELKRNQFSYKEIAKALDENCHLQTNARILSGLVHLCNHGTLLKQFKSLKFYELSMAGNFDVYTASDYSIKFCDNCWVTLETIDIPITLLITRVNLKTTISDPINRIKLKWLLRYFDMSNNQLFTATELNNEDLNKIDNIYKNILLEFDIIYRAVKEKVMLHLMEKNNAKKIHD